ncbi:MAG: anti-CBASS protein Acb1 family protein [Bradymonadaceae bacterium]
MSMWDGWNFDGIVNALTQLGSSEDRHEKTRPADGPTFKETQLDRLYLHSRLNRRIVDRPAQDATRRGWDVKVDDPQFEKDVFDADLKRLGVRQKCRKAHKLARQSGGAIQFIVADDGRTPDEPLDVENIRSVKTIHVLDRFEVEGVDEDGDIQSEDWRKPTYYKIREGAETDIEDGQLIHKSRVVRWEGLTVPDDRRSDYDGWGQPILEAAWDAIRDLEVATQALATSTHHFQYRVMRLADLGSLLHDEDGNADPSDFKQRLKAIQEGLSTIRMIVLDKEESVETKSVDFSGMIEVYSIFQQNLSAAVNIPLILLFGTPTKGLSSEDKTAIQNYYDHVSGLQDENYQPAIDFFIELLSKDNRGPTDGQVPQDWTVDFADLEEPTKQEQADTAAKLAKVDQILTSKQIIDPEEARQRWEGDELSVVVPLDDSPPEAGGEQGGGSGAGSFSSAVENALQVANEMGGESQDSDDAEGGFFREDWIPSDDGASDDPVDAAAGAVAVGPEDGTTTIDADELDGELETLEDALESHPDVERTDSDRDLPDVQGLEMGGDVQGAETDGESRDMDEREDSSDIPQGALDVLDELSAKVDQLEGELETRGDGTAPPAAGEGWRFDPYEGPDDPELPEDIQDKPEPLRAQFVAVFNDVYEKTDGNEAEAMKQARASIQGDSNDTGERADQTGPGFNIPVLAEPPPRLEGYSEDLRTAWLDAYNTFVKNNADSFDDAEKLRESALKTAWQKLVAKKVENVE